MELDEFVKSTLLQIMNGVKAAQDEVGEGSVNPYVNKHMKNKGVLFKEVKFDVAVTTQDKSETEGKGKISVLGASIGGGLDTEALSKIATRIQFDVPITYPKNKEKEK